MFNYLIQTCINNFTVSLSFSKAVNLNRIHLHVTRLRQAQADRKISNAALNWIFKHKDVV